MYDAVENNGKFTKWEALGQLMIMFAILGGVYYLSVLYDAPSRNPAVSILGPVIISDPMLFIRYQGNFHMTICILKEVVIQINHMMKEKAKYSQHMESTFHNNNNIIIRVILFRF